MEGAPFRLDALAEPDLRALRLAAQVMAHKADLAGRVIVGDFFRRLDRLADDAARNATPAAPGDGPGRQAAAMGLADAADADDRRLLAEYLSLLVSNERLSPAVRSIARDLQADIDR